MSTPSEVQVALPVADGAAGTEVAETAGVGSTVLEGIADAAEEDAAEGAADGVIEEGAAEGKAELAGG